MSQAGNPFFVDPSAGAEGLLAATMQLGDTAGQYMQKSKQRDVEDGFREAAEAKDYGRMLEISSTNPQFQRFALQQAGLSNEQQKQAAVKGYSRLLATKDPEARKDVLAGMADEIEMLGGDASDVMELMASELDPNSSTDEMAKISLMALSPETYKQMYPHQQKLADRRTTDERNWDRYQELLKKDPQKAAQFQSEFLQGGLGTLQERTDEGIRATKGKEKVKTEVQRRQGYIDSGVEAADSLEGLMRAKELASGIRTGGLESIRQRASEWFGIEGAADEGELRNLLAASVLESLKPIFGSAFTDAEGKRLGRIMASFEKSSSTNVRLLDKAIKLAEKSVRRAVRTAEEEGNDFEAEEIKRAAAHLFDNAESKSGSAGGGNGEVKEYNWANYQP